MSDTNQLWSDVLAYRPLLEATKRPTIIRENQLISEVNEQTKSLADYITYNPYGTFQTINDSISRIEDIEKLIESAIPNEISNIKESNDELDLLIEENKSIEGNSIYEVYKVVKNDKDMLSRLAYDFKYLNYGQVSDTDAEKINDTNISTIKSYELSNEYEKINYTNLALDSYVNSMIQSFSEDVANSSSKMFTTVTINPEVNVTGNKGSIGRIINEKYNSVLKTSDVDLNHYSELVDSDLVSSLYYQTCFSREIMNDAIDADISVPKYEEDNYIEVVMNIKDSAVNSAFNEAEEMMKGMLLMTIKKDDYIKTLGERQGLKNIFLGLK